MPEEDSPAWLGLMWIVLSFVIICDLLVLILLVAAGISAVSGNAESTLVILLVLIMNAVLGTVQHVKAQQSLESLKELSAPSVKVLRDGRKQEIPSEELVPGDIVTAEAGDLIVADGRLPRRRNTATIRWRLPEVWLPIPRCGRACVQLVKKRV